MANLHIFQPPSTDQSIIYLGDIFGYMGAVLPASSSTRLVAELLKTFNSIVLAVAAFMILYVTIVGVMKTAAEGDFLGKQWDSLWVPIRTVLGIAALIPSGTGYCGAQLIMMWVVVQGVGAADTIWSTALKYVDTMGSIDATLNIPTIDIKTKLSNLFSDIVCLETVSQTTTIANDISNKGLYYCQVKGCSNPITYSNLFNYDGRQTDLMVSGFSCGTVTSPHCSTCVGTQTDEDRLKCAACRAAVDRLNLLANDIFAPIAKSLVKADIDYRNFYYELAPSSSNTPQFVKDFCADKGISSNRCCVGTNCDATLETLRPYSPGDNYQNPSRDVVERLYLPYALSAISSNFIDTSTSIYITDILEAISNVVTSKPTAGDLADIEEKGWIYAGAFYFRIARLNQNRLANVQPNFDVKLDDYSAIWPEYRINTIAASYLLRETGKEGSGGGGDGGGGGGGRGGGSGVGSSLDQLPGGVGEAGDSIGAISGEIFKSFQNDLTGHGKNPIVQMQSFGWYCLLTVQILFFVIIQLLVIVGLLGFTSPLVVGTGIINPIGPTANMLLMFVYPFIFGLMGILFSIGALLSVYTPLVPYIIYTVGAIGWFILVLEAIVAAPLIALGVLSPTGHEMLGKGEHAIMLIFNVFLRPGLMVLGMMIGMLLCTVVATLINKTFSEAVGGINPYFVTPIEVILFLCAYTMLIITVLNKCFALIHILPDNVLRWVGGHNLGGHDEQAVAEAKRGTETAGGSVGGDMKSAGTGSRDALTSTHESRGRGAAFEQAEAKENAPPAAGTAPKKPPGTS